MSRLKANAYNDSSAILHSFLLTNETAIFVHFRQALPPAMPLLLAERIHRKSKLRDDFPSD